MRTDILIFSLLAALICPSFVRAGQLYLWEGFEREINWAAETDTAATGQVVDSEFFTEGGHSLRLLFNASSASARAEYEREETMDWSPYGAILFDVYVPAGLPDFRMGVEVETTDNKLKHQALTPPLAKGWNRDVRIDLTARVFSSAATDWRPVGNLVGRGDIRKVEFHLLPGTAVSGAACLDNVRLERFGLVAAGDFTLNTTLDATASGVRIDYLPTDMRIRRNDLKAVESFEGGASWTSPAGVAIEPASDFTSHGGSALSVTFPALRDGFELSMNGMESRLAGSRQLRMAIYNSGRGVSIALRLEDADGNTYTSEKVSLGHGWNKPIFDFTNQRSWNGDTINDNVLRNLSGVVLEIYPQYSGRLVFDGLAVGDLSLKGAAKAGALLSLSYNPVQDLELILNTRVEDTFYGSSFSRARDAGPEAFLHSAAARWDLGDFRTRLLYRQKVTAFDNPVIGLVSPENLGNEIGALEMSGRAGDTELQGLVASRLEYGRYDSHVPTGFGPENLTGLRLRRDLAEGVRLGGTFVNHAARYGRGVLDLPAHRQTWGLDLDARMGEEAASLGWALEGAVTTGDRYRDAVNIPRHDRYCVGTSIAPEAGRLKFSYGYTLIGYDFDADFTKKGGNTMMHSFELGADLDGWSVFRHLSALPIYDGSIGKNLRMDLSGYTYETRDRYADPGTGALRPRSAGWEVALEMENDDKARPNFNLSAAVKGQDDEWSGNPEAEETLSVRLPLPLELVAVLSGRLDQARPEDKTTGESGADWTRSGQIGLERWFKCNLSVNVNGNWMWTHSNWEGIRGEPEGHFKLTAGARQTFGANSVVQLDFGFPALYGSDYGIQDTINVFTLSVKTYF
jgi:hypothetical protein